MSKDQSKERDKPPLGIEPRIIHDDKRLGKLRAAIYRYEDAEATVPAEWYVEAGELTARFLSQGVIE